MCDCMSDVQRLTLEVLTLVPKCDSVETAEGVPLYVTGVAQVKVMKDKDMRRSACEQFLGKTKSEIESIILQTVEGHLRAILGTLTVEQIYQDRESFAQLVREVASPDVGRMGIEIVSFVIRDVYDKVNYLGSLGRAQTANVKRDAAVGVAEANRDAGIREAECEKSKVDVRYEAESKTANAQREFFMRKAQFDMEVNAKKAEAELAYDLQCAKLQQKIRAEQIEIDVVERRKQIGIEDKEVTRKDKELTATVRLPAEAEAFKVEQLADAKRVQRVEQARADSEKVRLIGEAEASAIEAVGKAEAEKMRLKAAAYKQYGEAAIVSLLLDTLPKMAAEVAAPLAKTGEIVMVGDDRMTGEVSRLMSQLPPTIQALTGVDVSKVLGSLPGAKTIA